MTRYVVLVSLVAGCARGVAPDPLVPEPDVPSRPSGESVLADMDATYANATSYADIGVVTMTLGNGKHEGSAEHSFRTDFVRPRLRFEVTDSSPSTSYVVFADGEQSLTESSTAAGRIGQASTELALRAADHPSYAVSRWIPTYLAGVSGRLPLGHPEVTGEDTVGGHDCWIVSATGSDEAYRLEIDKTSHLLRRLAHLAQVSSITMTEMVSYEPVLDDPEVEVEPLDVADKTVVSDLRSL